MLRIDFLPARHGDCIWLEYGAAAHPVRILIDGGPGFAYAALRGRLAALDPGQRYVDVLIVTHIDGDHIEGVIKLLRDKALGLEVKDIWFNGVPQITTLPMEPATASYGVIQGDYLGKLIKEMGIHWNRAFGGKAALAGTCVPLPCGATARLLSPTLAQLLRLRRHWNDKLAEAAIEPDATEEAMARLAAIRRLAPPLSFSGSVGLHDIAALASRPFVPDTALANGSSIAILFEYMERRLLLLGDGFSDTIEAALDQIAAAHGNGVLNVDLVKLPHHGSRANVGPSLLQKIQSERYVVLSDGSYFGHPDPEAIARVICHSPATKTLFFNYRTPLTAPWGDPVLQHRHRYRTRYPELGNDGISLQLID